MAIPEKQPRTQTSPSKPRLRGVSHVVGALGALVGLGFLIREAHGLLAVTGAWIYGLSLVLLFMASALYHLPDWSQGRRKWMRRLDHSAIFLLIAGTFTPISLLALPAESSRALMTLVWSLAGVGIVKSLVWIDAPKWLVSLLCVAMGWLAAPYMGKLAPALEGAGLTLVLAGGIAYTLGAAAYALKRPRLWPSWFGYHEVFHGLVVAAAACHYAAIYRLVSAVS